MRGYVYSVDNEPLINASVRLFNSEIGTVTDKKGRYEIQVPQGLNRIGTVPCERPEEIGRRLA
ncbi:MAG: carboxypeptidase-like regulatory domain-containing protein, partial [Spirosomaceae bacterium]|nr:carboxypeptidase-like regulatory domain-containing protein [Spirosomataceae bacterium]